MPESKAITDDDWERREEIIAGFEAAWTRGERPKIAHFLPDHDPLRHDLLVELVHADLEFRIKRGDSSRVEDYLRRYPSLGHSKQVVLDLIQTELTTRRRREPALGMEGYWRRFPELREELGTPTGHASPVKAPARSPRPEPTGRKVPGIETPLPHRFGKFELRERLGVGASGVVFRAWDTILQREVAVKVPRSAEATTPEIRVFLRDARTSINLKHPNIVEMIDASPIEGVECMVRAFVEGMTLADRLREGPIGFRESAELIAVVADAVDHAHGRGIIHRDLKPSNILIDRQGRPHVMDFGLSKCEAGESTLSPSGSPGLMIGTPAYMSPEQARGESYLVEARSDVHGLGVILYELLTGSLPFRGRGRMLLIQIEESAPIPPRSLNDEVPADLEAICLKALAKDPKDRPPTAKAMADDLRRFLDGKSFRDQPEPRATPSRPAATRSRKFAILVGIAAATVAIAGLAASWITAEARRQHDSAGLRKSLGSLLDVAEISPGPSEVANREPTDLAWSRARELETSLDGDPNLLETAVDLRLKLAGRATVEGSDRVAGPLWDHAIAGCEASLRASPGRVARMEDLAGALARRAEILARADRRGDAQADLKRSLLIRAGPLEAARRRALVDPTDDAQLDLAEILLTQAKVRRALGESVSVREVEAIASDLARRLASSSKRRVASLMLDLSRWHVGSRPAGRAEDWAWRALKIARDEGDSGMLVARVCLALTRADRDSEALSMAMEAIHRFESRIGPGSGRLEDRLGLAEARFEAGRLLDRSGNHAEAIPLLRSSINLRLAIDRDFPNAHATRAGIGEARLALAHALQSEGRIGRARANRLLAILDLTRAVALAPGEPASRRTFRQIAREAVGFLGR